ncbi:MAG: hypothetical protein HC771_09385 [Synechococcales cyanobacterium CRU_2_2]|nr:hypothetical protein [Synechococcales cyanobacterium CRU_2_2]
MMLRALAFILLSSSLAIAGCQSPQASLTQLSLAVKPSDQAGTYQLSGSSNLPDGTRLTVQGLRQLRSIHPGMAQESRAGFSILDQKIVKVTQGRWTTDLSLWKTAEDGTPAESWQIDLPDGARNFEADAEVLFTTTTPPSNDAQVLEQQWEASKKNPEGYQVGFTAEGRWYLRTQKALALTPPSVSQATVKAETEAIAIRPAQDKVDRREVDPAIEDPSLAQPLTDAAPAPQEMMR